MVRLFSWMRSLRPSVRRAGFVLLSLVGSVLGLAGVASATTNTATDPVTAGFSTVQTSLVNYVGLGVALVIAVFLVGIGVGLLVKWARRAVRAG